MAESKEDRELRNRTIEALRTNARLETDPGAKGYSEGMMQNFIQKVGAGRTLSVPYVEGIEAANALMEKK